MNDASDSAPSAARAPLPPDHAQRLSVVNEAHARPPQALTGPARMSYLAVLREPGNTSAQREHVCALVADNAPPPAPGERHYRAQLGELRFVWECHTEFDRYLFIVDGEPDEGFTRTALARAPEDWVRAIPGQLVVATHVALFTQRESFAADADIARAFFCGNPIIGADIAAGAGSAWTDFRLHADDCARIVVLNRAMTPRQCGRAVARLLEIDTYRVLAMLGLPVANELTPALNGFDEQLAAITHDLNAAGASEERALLEQLTRLQARVENAIARSAYRFAAARAYHALVRRRVHELREVRQHGLQTFQDFIERRLAPAMDTCLAVSRRQASILERVSRTTRLISTRVDIAREEHTQALLESMNRRAKLQLRLQQTVEGLSVAAITYYVVGLVAYAAKAAETAGASINAALIAGLSIPVVLIAVGFGIRRIRALIARARG